MNKIIALVCQFCRKVIFSGHTRHKVAPDGGTEGQWDDEATEQELPGGVRARTWTALYLGKFGPKTNPEDDKPEATRSSRP